MKRYEGVRTSDAGPQTVRVVPDDGAIVLLKHREHGSPDGFQWGYGGSGPSDLARSILWDHLGFEPQRSLYQEFKFAFVAGWGDAWSITTKEIDAWLAQQKFVATDVVLCGECGTPTVPPYTDDVGREFSGYYCENCGFTTYPRGEENA